MYNFIKNNKQLLINIFNFIVLFAIGIYLFEKFKYGFIRYDDLLDTTLGRMTHGRFLTQGFTILFCFIVPKFFNIHIQNFAVISIGLVFTLGLCFVIHNCSMSFFRFKKPNLFLSVLYIFTFIYCICSIEHLCGHLMICSHSWFLGYLFPIPLFLMFIFLLGKNYIKGEFSKKDLIILSILAFLLPSFNEMCGYSSFLLLLILAIKNDKLKFPFIFSTIMNMLVVLTGFALTFGENKSDFNLFALQNISDYIYTIYRVIFLDNIICWLIFLACIGFFIWKRNDEKVKRYTKFLICTYISLFLFIIIIYYMGDTCHYGSNFTDLRPFWITYFGISVSFKIIIICLDLYILGFILSYFNEKKYILSGYFILCILLAAILIPLRKDYVFDPNEKEYKKTLYMMDKFSIFYFKKGETAILPRQFVYNIFSNTSMPTDLDKEDFSQEIYYCDLDNNKSSDNIYLKYFAQLYSLDVTPGMTFRDDNEAIEIFKDNGGILTDEELEELDFNKLNSHDIWL